MSPQDRAVIAADAVRQRLVVIEAACRAIVDLAETAVAPWSEPVWCTHETASYWR